MFELWRARWQEKKVFKSYKKGVERFPVGSPEREQFSIEFGTRARRADAWTAFIRNRQLSNEAKVYDLELPRDTDDWTEGEVFGGARSRYVSPTGRLKLRRMIDAEKARRFEVKTLWVTKFWLPLLAALVGNIGALTGLVAVMQHKK